MLSGLFGYVFGGGDNVDTATATTTTKEIAGQSPSPLVTGSAKKQRQSSYKQCEGDWIMVKAEKNKEEKLLEECQSLSSSILLDGEVEAEEADDWIGASSPAPAATTTADAISVPSNFDALSRNKQQWLLTQMLFSGTDDSSPSSGKHPTNKESIAAAGMPNACKMVTSITGGSLNAKNLKRSGKAELAQSQAKIKTRYRKGVGAGGNISASHQNNDRKSNTNGGK